MLFVESPTFERTFVKMQNEKNWEYYSERRTITCSLRVAPGLEAEQVPIDGEDFAVASIEKRRMELQGGTESGFLNTKLLLPMSNNVERFFSTAKLTFSSQCQKPLLVHLEEPLFLKMNSRFYNEETVCKLC